MVCVELTKGASGGKGSCGNQAFDFSGMRSLLAFFCERDIKPQSHIPLKILVLKGNQRQISEVRMGVHFSHSPSLFYFFNSQCAHSSWSPDPTRRI